MDFIFTSVFRYVVLGVVMTFMFGLAHRMVHQVSSMYGSPALAALAEIQPPAPQQKPRPYVDCTPGLAMGGLPQCE